MGCGSEALLAAGKAGARASKQAGEAECPTCHRSANLGTLALRRTILPATTALYTHKMQSIPDARQQSFEELYGPPENFLEIEVRALP